MGYRVVEPGGQCCPQAASAKDPTLPAPLKGATFIVRRIYVCLGFCGAVRVPLRKVEEGISHQKAVKVLPRLVGLELMGGLALLLRVRFFCSARLGPNLAHQTRTVAWLTSTPCSNSNSCTPFGSRAETVVEEDRISGDGFGKQKSLGRSLHSTTVPAYPIRNKLAQPFA